MVNINIFEVARNNPKPLVVISAALILLIIVVIVFAAYVGGSDANEGITINNISSHVLDIAVGRPASGMNCTAYYWNDTEEEWTEIGFTITDHQGRIPVVHPNFTLTKGMFKLQFATKPYFQLQKRFTFYPFVEIVFEVDDVTQHYHVPLTLSNFGYSTYKGQ